jgi:membrane protease YdiL (CAAX protease family)
VPDHSRAAAVTGLLVAWGGTALLVSPAARILGNPSSTISALLGQLVFWLLGASVLAIVVFWERQPLSSLWLKPVRWPSIAWGLLLALVLIGVIGPLSDWLRRLAGLPGFAQGMEALAPLPAWLRIAAAVTAGSVEEVLFHGYAITRLARLLGSIWVAGVIATAVFAVLHYPLWGAGPVLGFFTGGLFTTAFLIWRRDLVTMMVAHVIVDVRGIGIGPMAGEWWQEEAP